jgi:hypothetical protein
MAGTNSVLNSDHDTSSVGPHDEKARPKKIRINASNGWDKLSFSNGKLPDPKLTTPIVKRPRTNKVKLTELPSLPLDVMYEVRVNTPTNLP